MSVGFMISIDLQANKILFDRDSIYPFLILLLVPASLFLKIGWHAIFTIRRSCVVIGIFVCALNNYGILINMDDYLTLVSNQRLLYAPLCLGLLLSLLLAILEPRTAPAYTLKKSEGLVLGIFFLMAVIASVYFVLGGDLQIISLIEPRAFGLCVIIMAVCCVHPEHGGLSFVEKSYRASLGAILIVALSGLSLWTYAVTLSDVTEIGGLVSFAVLGFMYASGLGLLAISAGGQLKQTKKDATFYDWHIIEAYAFYTLIVLPPLSFLEYFQMVMDLQFI